MSGTDPTAEGRDKFLAQALRMLVFRGWRGFPVSQRECALVPPPSAGTGYVGPRHFAALEHLRAYLPRAVFRPSPEPGVYLVFGVPRRSPTGGRPVRRRQRSR